MSNLSITKHAKDWITSNMCDGYDRSESGTGDVYSFTAKELYEVAEDLSESIEEVINCEQHVIYILLKPAEQTRWGQSRFIKYTFSRDEATKHFNDNQSELDSLIFIGENGITALTSSNVRNYLNV